MKQTKRIVAMLLAIMMVFSMGTTSIFAAESTPADVAGTWVGAADKTVDAMKSDIHYDFTLEFADGNYNYSVDIILTGGMTHNETQTDAGTYTVEADTVTMTSSDGVTSTAVLKEDGTFDLTRVASSWADDAGTFNLINDAVVEIPAADVAGTWVGAADKTVDAMKSDIHYDFTLEFADGNYNYSVDIILTGGMTHNETQTDAGTYTVEADTVTMTSSDGVTSTAVLKEDGTLDMTRVASSYAGGQEATFNLTREAVVEPDVYEDVLTRGNYLIEATDYHEEAFMKMPAYILIDKLLSSDESEKTFAIYPAKDGTVDFSVCKGSGIVKFDETTGVYDFIYTANAGANLTVDTDADGNITGSNKVSKVTATADAITFTSPMHYGSAMMNVLVDGEFVPYTADKYAFVDKLVTGNYTISETAYHEDAFMKMGMYITVDRENETFKVYPYKEGIALNIVKGEGTITFDETTGVYAFKFSDRTTPVYVVTAKDGEFTCISPMYYGGAMMNVIVQDCFQAYTAKLIQTEDTKLAAAKKAAKTAIDTARATYADADYKAEQVAELNQIVTDAKAAVDAATTVEEIQPIVDGVDAKLDAVLTSAELPQVQDLLTRGNYLIEATDYHQDAFMKMPAYILIDKLLSSDESEKTFAIYPAKDGTVDFSVCKGSGIVKFDETTGVYDFIYTANAGSNLVVDTDADGNITGSSKVSKVTATADAITFTSPMHYGVAMMNVVVDGEFVPYTADKYAFADKLATGNYAISETAYHEDALMKMGMYITVDRENETFKVYPNKKGVVDLNTVKGEGTIAFDEATGVYAFKFNNRPTPTYVVTPKDGQFTCISPMYYGVAMMNVIVGDCFQAYTAKAIVVEPPVEPIVPVVPTITKANSMGTTLNVEWDAVEGAESYRVAFYNYTYKKWYYYETADTDFQIGTAVGGRKYLAKVTSLYTKDGEATRTDYSEGVEFTSTLDTPEMTYVGIGDNTNELRVNWEAVKGAKSYRVAIFNETHDRWYYYNTADLTFDVQTAEGGRNYIFKVRAIDGKYDSAYTSNDDAVEFTTAAVPTITTANADGLELNVEWDAVKGVDSYRVAIYNYTYKKYYYYETSETDFQVNTAEGGRKYKVVISALVKNDKGEVLRTDYSHDDAKYITTEK